MEAISGEEGSAGVQGNKYSRVVFAIINSPCSPLMHMPIPKLFHSLNKDVSRFHLMCSDGGGVQEILCSCRGIKGVV
ncbi:hypothetical protein GYH30_004419 [Glycine max]|uniref:Uncharacterized protein n=2 Tax=Glycine subgen. Soja TaxID=1462606 RepID=A0A0R0L8M9_SOYBN|nr:hypothetical protein JHK87_004455 [Glycine soja]KAH1060928.1 hypothetical protein GYH30_004419 [Glycine max]RZC25572.1 hypothetical protein D0Y65_004315 [Glycine soja]